MTWSPSAGIAALQQRARMNQIIRQFFDQHCALEVETPVLSQAAVADANIEPMRTADERWLQTSPEYPMKRLLCAGSGDIYQIAKVFRRGEAGRRHNPEFSMLEWYRLGIDLSELMQQVATLTRQILAPRWPSLAELHLTYQQAFERYVGLNPHTCHDAELVEAGRQVAGQELSLDRDGWLDVLMSHCVEPALPTDTLVFVRDFPASQAALAKTDMQAGISIARRFELYLNGNELANGYDELDDAAEQRRRFEREANGRPLDENLLEALEQGLPPCCGVAMGLDRLLMLLLDADHIADVLAFDWQRA
ncbi:hypothetical protein CHH28_09395 [Bacterioplanes sanyensis]|uniref:Aminoacyl-transfer RNA synthetases class-II family profile domain-containing protein n=1 Tax=Bacterioplanes sanyensis TaxID=1249553 RepID=A0A222FKY9_9GAMM|nr:EF-P lysine aminoacylase EpmA [Bacterioplanes sanyensis]ASP38883.1 hypothetical protein CHH28_09395 [Bacterioplanes sanyensis]